MNMTDSEDELHLVSLKTPNTTKYPSTNDLISDSEDDDILSSSMAGNDALDRLNLSSNLKNILRLGGYSNKNDNNGILDDGDSESDSELRAPTNYVDIEKLNAKLAESRDKFKNFPLMPPSSDAEVEEKESTNKGRKKKATATKEKKKRRDKDNKKKQQQEQARLYEQTEKDRKNNFSTFQARLQLDQSSSDEEDNEQQSKKKSKKNNGRKTRKLQSKEPIVDENGERLVRQTDLLDSSSESESSQPDVLSKKQQLEMYKETERLRRSKQISLKPTYHVKSFEDLIKRHDARYTRQLPSSSASNPAVKTSPTQSKRSAAAALEEDSDSDLEIIGDPKKIASALLSPDRARLPLHMPILSSNNTAATVRRQHNSTLLSKVSFEAQAHHQYMVSKSKLKGIYTSPAERAKQMLEKEKSALLINRQVEQHFKNNNNKSSANYSDEDDDDEEEDEDYEGIDEDEAASGTDDDEENTFSNKRKGQVSAPDSDGAEEDEQDMGVGAFKRWRNKKHKKSLFSEDEEEEEEEKIAKKKEKNPVPTHSIANFFKNKEVSTVVVEEDENIDNRPLARLVRRDSLEEVEEDEEDNMDIDEQPMSPRPQKQPTVEKLARPKEKNEYFEEEAEEEEDEFFGVAGEDEIEGENLDEFEKDDLLVEDDGQFIDEATLREAFNKQDIETDNNMIQRLMKDIAGGGLRRQKAAAAAGIMLDDLDLYDDDNDLLAIRAAAELRRRKLLKRKGGDAMQRLMNDPKTQAFAKASLPIHNEAEKFSLDNSDTEEVNKEEEEKEDEKGDRKEDNSDAESLDEKRARSRLIIQEDEDEEEDGDIEQVQESSDDENDIVIVDQYDAMATSPLRDGFVNNDNNNEPTQFNIENMKSPLSPLTRRKATSIFNLPNSSDRFKRLLRESSQAVNGNGTFAEFGSTRVGFSSLHVNKNSSNHDFENESNTVIDDGLNSSGRADSSNQKKKDGSISGFMDSTSDNPKSNRPRQSKLGALKKKDAFT